MTLFYEVVIFDSRAEITIKYVRSFGGVNSFKQVAFISENKYNYDL